jgi:hypothetical protein
LLVRFSPVVCKNKLDSNIIISVFIHIHVHILILSIECENRCSSTKTKVLNTLIINLYCLLAYI